MVNWLLVIVLSAVIMAEVMDALAMRRLFSKCQSVGREQAGNVGLQRWYAQGFQHSVMLTGWLAIASAALGLLAFFLQAHPMLIVACVVLALVAHVQRYLSVILRRKFVRVSA